MMDLLPSIIFGAYTFVIIATMLLAFIVYRNNKHSTTNQIFIFLSIITVIWLGLTYISSHHAFLFAYLALARATIVFAPPQAAAFFLLAHTIPSDHLRLSKRWLAVVIAATAVAMLLCISPYVFSSVSFQGQTAMLHPGAGMPLFVLVVSGLSAGAIITLIRHMRQQQGVEKKQLLFVLIGIFLMLGLIISTIMVPIIFFQSDSFLPFASLYMFIFLAMTAIAILRYKLFDLKVIATEFLVIVLVLVLLFESIVSNSAIEVILKFALAFVVGILGILLIRSVRREVRQREEVTHLARSLEQANIRLQELDRQKNEFLSIASHQLRTPLSILKGYIELIQDGAYGKPTQKLLKVLGDMDESNERLIKLVDEFLDISRIEQGRTKFSFAEACMDDLVDSVVKELTERANKAGIAIDWKRGDKLCNVRLDEDKIRHVVFNFVDNAIKYSTEGTITVSAIAEDGGVAVRVRDQGIGFEKEDQANFFQKFYRGKNVKTTNVNGTGLGIYVCKKFIDAHDGRVWAESEGLGKGGEFGFWIPFAPSGEPAKMAGSHHAVTVPG